MAGIYIHVPFCKKICSYCDFYRTAEVSLIPGYLRALEKELDMRTAYLCHEMIDTIYLGGGTPSLLSAAAIQQLIRHIMKLHQVSADCEITLEANPDDVSAKYMKALREETRVNRISIGIQSFRDHDLKLLGRRHNAKQAIESLEHARKAGFTNLAVDLIYGLPGMDTRHWQKNLDQAFSAEITHLSAYHLSIEPGTVFSRLLAGGHLKIADEEESAAQFALLHDTTVKNEFIHYEISNAARPGYFSRHNTHYWLQKQYLGIGPSAHSYNITSRQWNIAHVRKYTDAIQHHAPYFEVEDLDAVKRYNEYLMVSLRTIWGADLEYIQREFGSAACEHLRGAIQAFIMSGHLIREGQVCRLTTAGWMISDYIISTLMKA